METLENQPLINLYFILSWLEKKKEIYHDKPVKFAKQLVWKCNKFNDWFFILIIQRNFCLSLEQHKRLFWKDTKFRTLISDAEKNSDYDARTAYTGTVKGTYVYFL